jgi:hypothetical protein
MGEGTGAYRVLVVEYDGNRPLGRPRHRCKDKMKTYLHEVGWEGMDWIDLAQDSDRWRALVNAAVNLGVP